MKMKMSHLPSDLIKAEDRAINIVDEDEDIIDPRVQETETGPVCQPDSTPSPYHGVIANYHHC